MVFVKLCDEIIMLLDGLRNGKYIRGYGVERSSYFNVLSDFIFVCLWEKIIYFFYIFDELFFLYYSFKIFEVIKMVFV